MRIQANLAAYSAQAKLTTNSSKKEKSIEKLSSGLRLNRSADDAAGVSISEKMRSQIRGMNRASANVQDGVSMLSVADGSLQEVSNMLHRIRELSVQAGSDTNEESDKKAIQMEVTELISEVNKELIGANFNGIPLFDGTHVGTYEYAYGMTAHPTITPTDPAQIIAPADFQASEDDPLIISGGTYPVQKSYAGNNFLQELNTDPPNYPKEGVFVIQVQLDSTTKKDAILDFSSANADGAFNLDDFREFYIGKQVSTDPVTGKPVYDGGEFSEWINNGWMTFTISDEGEMSLSTAGPYGGSTSRVAIGATTVSGVTSYANAAILGAGDSDYESDYGYKTNLTATSTSQLSSFSQQDLWNALSQPIQLSYQTYSYSESKYLPDSIMTFSTNGFSTLADFNAYVRNNIKTQYYSDPGDFSLVPTLDRNGNVHVYLQNSYSTTNYIPPSAAYSNSNHFISRTYPDTYVKADSGSKPTVISDYPAQLSDRIGTLEITISGIPDSSSTKAAKVTVDFATKKATMGSVSIGFTDAASMASAIQTLLNNNADNHPDPPPTIKPSGYDTAKPVASVTISGGKLLIEASERTFSISVTEKQSDRPMFYDYKSDTGGTNQSRTLQIEGVPAANVSIAPGSYKSIDEFIEKNAKAFEPNYILKTDNTGKKLIIESKAGGMGVDVQNIKFSSSVTPANLLTLLGFSGVTKNDPNVFIDGVTYAAQPVPPNGLWIQGGANTDEGLFIYAPRLNAYDLGLMVRPEDLLAPGGDHRADGGVNGDNSISGTGGVGMGLSMYSTEANIEPIPKGYGLDVTTAEKASLATTILDNAINIINKERGNFGASQNRLEYMNKNLNIGAENLTNAESRIRDSDMAAEMTQLTRQSIKTESATAMLAQANSLPQAVLQLLG